MGDGFDTPARDICVAVRNVRDAIPGWLDGMNKYLDAVYSDPTGYVPGDTYMEYCNSQMALYNALSTLNKLRLDNARDFDNAND